MRRVLILGGGVSGLVAAYRRLQRAQQEGTAIEFKLIESSDRLGGAIRTSREGGFVLEHGPDCFLSAKPQALELCRELGLEAEVISTRPQHRRSFIAKDDRLLPVPEGLYLMAPGAMGPFLGSPLLSWKGKLRVAMEPFVKRRKDAVDESLAHFVRRRLGREALERIAQPMVSGIYTADPEKLSLAATMPQFIEMERTQGSVVRALRRQNKEKTRAEAAASGPRYSLFLSLRHGLESLPHALAKQIPQEHVRLRTKAWRARQNPKTKIWSVAFENHSPIEAEELVIALPAFEASSLFWDQDRELANLLGEIEYSGVATINLAFRRDQVTHPLDGMGFVVPEIEKSPLVACTFSHEKFEGRAPEGFVLLRGFAGGAMHPEVLKLSDASLIEQTFGELRRFLRITGEPHKVLLSRYPRSMPQYHMGHIMRVVKILERAALHPGLRLIGNGYRGVGIPDCVGVATAI